MTAYEKLNGEWVLQGSPAWYDRQPAFREQVLVVDEIMDTQQLDYLTILQGAHHYRAEVNEMAGTTQVVFFYQTGRQNAS